MVRPRRVLTLRELASKYELRLGKAKVWTPYWINWDMPPYWKGAPFRGKGSPEQIQLAAQRKLSLLSKPLTDADDIRVWLKEAGLGVDCSGFVYYVLSRYLVQLTGLGLANYLWLSEDEIKELVPRYPALKLVQFGSVPLVDVMALLHKLPAMWVGTRRLLNPLNVLPVSSAKDVRPGDLISTTSQYGPHIAIVLETDESCITYGASEDEENGLGGVRLDRCIQIVEPKAGLKQQKWEQSRLFSPRFDSSGRPAPFSDWVWRLRKLDGLT